MDARIEEEKQHAIQSQNVEGGMPFVTSKVDGGWCKRTYGHGFAAKSGVACVVGAHTRKLLSYGVRNKFCLMCKQSENAKKEPPTHSCSKNFSGASTSMEADIIVECVRNLFEEHGVWSKFIVGDGDSNVFNKVQQLTPRGRDCVKLECANHKVKCYTSKLHGMLKNTSYDIEGRKIMEPRVKRLTSAARGAIRQNAGTSVALSKRDLLNGPNHVFGEHGECDTSYCERKDSNEENWVPTMKKTNLWADIFESLQPLVLKADKLLHNFTTNDCESFMSTVSKLSGGKRCDLSTGLLFEFRCAAAGLLFNLGPGFHLVAWERSQGRPLGEVAQRAFRELDRATQRKRHRRDEMGPAARRMERQQQQGAPADSNYGATHEQTLEKHPDLDADALQAKMDEILQTLQSEVQTPEDVKFIEEKTRGQADCEEWEQYRKLRLTASKHGEVFSKRDTTLRGALVESIYLKVRLSGDQIFYGIRNEKRAKCMYMDQFGVQVEDCGLFIRPDLPFLGASPDGLVGTDGVVEVKCFSKVGDKGILETYNDPKLKKKLRGVLKDEKVKTWRTKTQKGKVVRSLVSEVMVVPNKKHNYYIQIQSQLAITNRKCCDLILYCDSGIEVFRIERDEVLWAQIKKKLTLFYMDCLLPEFADSRLRRDLPPREPQYVIEARRKAGLSLPFDAM